MNLSLLESFNHRKSLIRWLNRDSIFRNEDVCDGGCLQKICFSLQNRGIVWIRAVLLNGLSFENSTAFFEKGIFQLRAFERIFFRFVYPFEKKKMASAKEKKATTSARTAHDPAVDDMIDGAKGLVESAKTEIKVWLVFEFFLFFQRFQIFAQFYFEHFFKFYSFEKNVDSKMNYFSEFGELHLQVEAGQSGVEDDDWCWWGGHRDAGWKKQGDFFVFVTSNTIFQRDVSGEFEIYLKTLCSFNEKISRSLSSKCCRGWNLTA